MAEITSLSALLKRLETATTKLEDLALAGASATNVSALTGNTGAPPVQEATHPHIEGYDELVDGPVKTFYELSKLVGGDVEEQARYVCSLFAAQREMIRVATLSQKPPVTSAIFAELLKPTMDELTQVVTIRDPSKRSSPLWNHLNAVAEGIPALGWEPKPAPFITEMINTAQFWANRVMTEYKEKDQNHVQWVRSFTALLTDLNSYVRKFHTTGLVWNPKGNALDSNSLSHTSAAPASAASSSVPPAPAAGGPPPPPPPPPPPAPSSHVDIPAPSASKPANSDMSAVFAQLNQGEGITSGLRKVDKSKMTHKNPELRTSGVVSASAGNPTSPKKAGPGTPPKPASLTLKKQPKLTLEGNKWVVENFENNNEVILDKVEINHSVYIFGCKNSTIQIKGKVTTVGVDSCTKTALCLESAISSLDVVNSKSVQVQILGRVPTVSLDKVDSCMVYLSKECLDADFLTSKCSALNILTPDSTEAGREGDFVERAVPEQFLTKIVDGRMVTTPVEHNA
ncbi:hypothetical protein BGX34_002367 [Mortierella sp. NVP85]|nr:hypothetical protein BGX34_002367 [Mortierella sp. NVP85]